MSLSLRLTIRVTATRHRSDSRAQERGYGRRGRGRGGDGGSQTMRAAARLIGRQHVCCCVVLLRRFAVAIHAQLTCLTAVCIVVGCMPHACLLHLRPACHLHNLYISDALTHTHTHTDVRLLMCLWAAALISRQQFLLAKFTLDFKVFKCRWECQQRGEEVR